MSKKEELDLLSEDSDKDDEDSSSSDEEEEEENADDEEDEEADPDEKDMDETEDNEGYEFEDFSVDEKKKQTKKTMSKKLFPFLNKRKKIEIEPRDDDRFLQLEVRASAKPILISRFKESEYEKIEKTIYNYSVRECKKLGIKLTLKNPTFKTVYVKTLTHVIGTPDDKITIILKELSENISEWNSSLYQEGKDIEKKDLEKIKNPEVLSEYPNNPCPNPKCRGTKHFMRKVQTRAADEGMSAKFWCGNKECKEHWTVHG